MRNLLIATLVATMLLAVTAPAQAMGKREQSALWGAGGAVAAIGIGSAINNAGYQRGYADAQAVAMQQPPVMTAVGQNGGAAEFQGLCTTTWMNFPAGAIFSGWVRNWQGQEVWSVKNVPPGTYPPRCF